MRRSHGDGASTAGSGTGPSLLSVKRVLVLLGAVALLSTGCSATPYAAIVNGHTISVGEVNDEIHAISSDPQYAAEIDQELASGSGVGGLHPAGPSATNSSYVAQLLYNRILVRLIEDEIHRQGIVVTPEQRRAAEVAARHDVRDSSGFDSLAADYRSYLIERQAELQAILDARSTPEKVRAHYEAHRADYTKYCVSHILVQTLPQAQAIRNQLLSGADFATLAQQTSASAGGGGPQDGVLGCGTASDLGSLSPEFRDAVLALQPGGLTEPVHTSYGYHIVKLTSVQVPTFDQLQPTIKSQLADAGSFFSEQLKSARIKVNPRYGDFHPGDATTGQSANLLPHPAKSLPEQGTKIGDAASGGGFNNLGG